MTGRQKKLTASGGTTRRQNLGLKGSDREERIPWEAFQRGRAPRGSCRKSRPAECKGTTEEVGHYPRKKRGAKGKHGKESHRLEGEKAVVGDASRVQIAGAGTWEGLSKKPQLKEEKDTKSPGSTSTELRRAGGKSNRKKTAWESNRFEKVILWGPKKHYAKNREQGGLVRPPGKKKGKKPGNGVKDPGARGRAIQDEREERKSSSRSGRGLRDFVKKKKSYWSHRGRGRGKRSALQGGRGASLKDHQRTAIAGGPVRQRLNVSPGKKLLKRPIKENRARREKARRRSTR